MVRRDLWTRKSRRLVLVEPSLFNRAQDADRVELVFAGEDVVDDAFEIGPVKVKNDRLINAEALGQVALLCIQPATYVKFVNAISVSS